MAILQIHAQGPWQRSFVTRYHLKIITICSGFCSGAFRQSEIRFTALERETQYLSARDGGDTSAVACRTLPKLWAFEE